MKKMLATLLVCLTVFCTSVMAQKTTTTTTTTTSSHNARVMRFYYYPSSNVYYNPTDNDYWYYDDATSKWTSVPELPTTVHLVKTDKVTVYHTDGDVWKDNADHIKKYKMKKNGTVKAKGSDKM